MSKDFSHQFKQVPGQAFREVNGFTTKLNRNAQAKHLEDSRYFIKTKSPITISLQEAQYLIEHYAGTGQWSGDHTEFIDFGHKIGIYIRPDTGERVPTTRARIHYGSAGAHMVPAPPTIPEERKES